MMGVVLVIIDGLGDEYIESLGGTPLDYASSRMRALNTMAAEGVCGIMHPISPGVPPSSDIGHLAIFGYDIRREYPGRGYFEAMGAGIRLKDGVAFRVNLATVERRGRNLIVIDRRAGRISGSDAEELYRALDAAIKERGLQAEIVHTFEHRGVLILRGEELCGAVYDTDPHEVGVPVLAAEPWDEISSGLREIAARVAAMINEITRLSYDVLEHHDINARRRREGLPPANIILVRGGGVARRIASFREKWGMRAAFVAAGPLYKGIARALGMDEMHVEGATGTPNTNLPGKVEACIRALDMGYDFVYLHIKGTDNLSHDKKPLEKAKFLMRIDEALSPLLDLEDVLIVVTGDHATSSIRGRHIGLPVPIVFWGTTHRDNVTRFSERECSRGCLGVLRGKDVMPLIMDLTDRSAELGTRPSKNLLLL